MNMWSGVKTLTENFFGIFDKNTLLTLSPDKDFPDQNKYKKSIFIGFQPPLTASFSISLALCSIQPFRERLSEKVLTTIPKGIVGGFKFTVLQRNLKE